MVWEVEEESAWVRAVEIGGNYATVLHILLLRKGFREKAKKNKEGAGNAKFMYTVRDVGSLDSPVTSSLPSPTIVCVISVL